MPVARGRLSVSRQVEANGVHQTDTDSKSVPVPGLKPLGKSQSLYLGQLPPPGTHGLSWVGSHGVIGVRPAEFIGPKETTVWPVKGGHHTGTVASARCAREKYPRPYSRITQSLPVHLCLPKSIQTSWRAFRASLHRGPRLAAAS